jgi:hypothetical protein
MPQDIKVLFLLLIVILIMVVLMQNNNQNNNQCVEPDEIKKKKESFALDNELIDDIVPSEMMDRNNTMDEMNNQDRSRAMRNMRIENMNNTMDEMNNNQDRSRAMRDMRRGNINNRIEQELDKFISNDGDSSQSSFENPMDENINMMRNNVSSSNVDNNALEELINEVNTGNDLRVNSTENKIFQDRSRSINSAKNYRKVSYADSEYRYNFNGNENNSDFSELADYTNEANNILDNKKTNNSTFNGYPDGNINFSKNDNNMSVRGYLNQNELYSEANLKDFSNPKSENQQQKVMNLYNSDSYLPNNKYTNPQLTEGFQILENPVSVNNPNLIPVLRSIPVSSVMGSNRNSTYDIRSEPPNPKTVVSPFLNSSIQPDIYATNRGCL